MTGAAAVLPPLPQIAAALRAVTETLARELISPTPDPPPWSDFEWRIARVVASIQGVSPLLRARLQWKRPASWRRFLEEQRHHVEGRHRKIVTLLQKIDAGARRDGLALVALKGAALHAIGIYQPGERPMADIDLLAREVEVPAAIRLLDECGFKATFSARRHQTFEAITAVGPIADMLGENIDSPIKVELHTSIREHLPLEQIEITRFVFPTAPHPGLNAYPSAPSLMMHLLLHAAGNMRAHALRLIQLHDIARLAGRLGPGDWKELLAARPNGHPLWWAVPPLLLTERYSPASVPVEVIGGLQKECPWLLGKLARRQRLTDVSWSNIRVHALPGVQWSRTATEALRFAMSRIWPNPDARRELHFYAAHHPGAADVPWYGISQGARIVRWIFSKPPRVQTLLSIRAALAQSHETAGNDGGGSVDHVE